MIEFILKLIVSLVVVLQAVIVQTDLVITPNIPMIARFVLSFVCYILLGLAVYAIWQI